MCKFQQKILNSMLVGARQNFQFFRQKTGFLGIIEVYLNLGIGFCITWLVIPNYKLTTRDTLNNICTWKLDDFCPWWKTCFTQLHNFIVKNKVNPVKPVTKSYKITNRYTQLKTVFVHSYTVEEIRKVFIKHWRNLSLWI